MSAGRTGSSPVGRTSMKFPGVIGSGEFYVCTVIRDGNALLQRILHLLDFAAEALNLIDYEK